MVMHILITATSYFALLLLLMRTTVAGIIKTAVLFLLGLALILWKKPWIKERPKVSQLLISAFSAAYLGYCFYNKWMPASKVHAIASLLHLSTTVLIGLTAALLTLIAMYAIVFALQVVAEQLSKLEEKQQWIGSLLRCFLAATVTVIMSQIMIDVGILSMGYLKFLCGVAIVSDVILLLYSLSGNIRVSYSLGTGWFMLLATANAYVYRFRGRLFEPVDVFSIGTAMNVAENYSLWPVPFLVIVGWIIWIGALIWLFQRSGLRRKNRIPIKARIVLLICCVLAALPISGYAIHLKTYHWDRGGAISNGYVLDFASKIKEAYVSKPDGYREEVYASLAEQYPKKTDNSVRQHPHIIVVMDEAFSDLSVLGKLSTDTEVMPFVSSLRQDAVTGYALVSVHGGNTSNSEFEFLTGNSMAWLSPNAVPYQNHVKPSAYSMVSYLKSEYHYQCIAMHPFHSSGWNRPTVYANLGFDECLFLENFPQEDLIRNFVSDREMFEKLVDVYEAQHQSPLFLFGVTMQNHGGYNYRGEDFEPSVSLVGYDREFADAEQYLSLVKESDKAVEYLISYFSGVEDDVVIVFFGDHQPKLNDAFCDELSGGAPATLDEQQKRFLVPFFIWANYDIEEEHLERISLNYLSSYVYEAAGLPLPPYNQFLSDMEEAIPAINANGFYSREEDRYLPFDMASGEEKKWLEMYEQLQYNALFDKEHRSEVFFPTGD